jgi:predicted translin family RNA/ssDNA-binding protein
MGNGIGDHGDDLLFTAAEITEMQEYPEEFDIAKNILIEESADVDAVYVGVRARFSEMQKQYVSCQDYIRGEMVFASGEDAEYLNGRFDIYGELPRTRHGVTEMVRAMVNGYDSIGVELPSVTLPDVLFEDLRTKLDDYVSYQEDGVKEEIADRDAAAVFKNNVRAKGEKLMRKLKHRAFSLWGDDDPRLWEIGLVPKSSIGTPSEPEPEPVEFTATVTRVDVGEWDFWCSRPEGVEDAKIDLLMLPDGPMIVLIEQMLVEEGKFVQHRSSDIGPGSYKAIFTAFDASGVQWGDVVAVEFTEEG